MKKYNISRKNKTHKKYNNTLLRRINKHFNLTRTMKGGVKKVNRSIEELQNLIENIKIDETFDPLGSPIFAGNRTKANDIQFVNDALKILGDRKEITDSTRQHLKDYINHYEKKKQYQQEKNFEYLIYDLYPESLYNSADIKRAQAEYLQQLPIIEEKPLLGVWLGKYIKLLSKYEYFNYVQEERIDNQLTTIIVAANASNASNASNAMEKVEQAMKKVENASIANIERLRNERNEKLQAAAGTDPAMATAMRAAVARAKAEAEAQTKAKAVATASATTAEETAEKAAEKAEEKAVDNNSLELPPPRPLPPPGGNKGGKTKRIVKRNVKSKKKKRRNRY